MVRDVDNEKERNRTTTAKQEDSKEKNSKPLIFPVKHNHAESKGAGDGNSVGGGSRQHKDATWSVSGGAGQRRLLRVLVAILADLDDDRATKGGGSRRAARFTMLRAAASMRVSPWLQWAWLGNVSVMNLAGNGHAGDAARLRGTMVGCDGDREIVAGVLIVLVDWGCVRRGGMVVEGGVRKKWCGVAATAAGMSD
ncbi:hypothetical protein Drorol1_Dr00010889 [Drosera rotundifolia]